MGHGGVGLRPDPVDVTQAELRDRRDGGGLGACDRQVMLEETMEQGRQDTDRDVGPNLRIGPVVDRLFLEPADGPRVARRPRSHGNRTEVVSDPGAL